MAKRKCVECVNEVRQVGTYLCYVCYEKEIELSNQQYLRKGVADVRKIPTPVKIISNNKGRVSGFVTKGELVDYVGIFQGQAIAFDAKETSVATSFALSNIPEHQYKLLESWHEKGAIAFLIVRFTSRNETYRVPFELLQAYWKGVEHGGRKSLPYGDFLTDCEPISKAEGFALHYLK